VLKFFKHIVGFSKRGMDKSRGEMEVKCNTKENPLEEKGAKNFQGNARGRNYVFCPQSNNLNPS
jgi:hypothetical protein